MGGSAAGHGYGSGSYGAGGGYGSGGYGSGGYGSGELSGLLGGWRSAAQVKMATDTDRQIADLRTQGEFAKANQVLEISQAYLQQLMSLEQWAAEYNLSAAKFQETVRQWEQEFALSVGQVTGSYQGQTTMAAKKYSDSLLAESGSALLSAGVMPNSEQLAAMGLTQAQARLLLGR